MDRREFNVSLLKASAVAILPRFSARAFADEPSPINALYFEGNRHRLPVCSVRATLKRTPERTSSPQYASPATGVNFTISVPDFNETVYNLGNVQKLVDDHP